MQGSKYIKYLINHSPLIIILFFFTVISCKKEKEIIQNISYNTIYEVDTIPLYQSAADKTKQKTSTQYISILYADLFQKSIPSNDLNEITQLNLAIGDKGLANEMLIGNYVKDSTIIIPTDTEMRSNMDKFIDDVYIRFYLRKPTELEKYYLKNIIQADSTLKPDDVYTSFSLSNEYLFY